MCEAGKHGLGFCLPAMEPGRLVRSHRKSHDRRDGDNLRIPPSRQPPHDEEVWSGLTHQTGSP
eukprot:5170405-Prorocentrum_lima.AAC.1